MKCARCGGGLEQKKEVKDTKVVLSNPREVDCKANVITCQHCSEEHVEGEDVFNMASNFDDAYSNKNNK